MAKKNWELLPHFILRSTGFPYNQLESLAFTQTSAALDACLDREDQLAALRAQIQEALHTDNNPDTRKQRRHFWKQIGRNRPLALDEQNGRFLSPDLWTLLQKWTPLLSQYQSLKEKAQAIFEEEMVAKRTILRDLAADEPFQEAVWLSSPQMYRHGLTRYLQKWQPQKRRSDTRRVERQIVSYLQRFAAKNDTAGFFGPVNYGRFTPPDHTHLSGPGHKYVKKRQAFIAYWAIQAITEAIADDAHIQPHLQPYRIPLCQVVANQLIIGHKAKVPLPQPTIRLWQQIDGQQTVAQIAAQIGQTVPATLKALQQLAKIRAVGLNPPIPVTTLNPLDWLCHWVEALPANCATRSHWQHTLIRFKQLQDRFATIPFAEKRPLLAEMETLLTETTQQVARRSGGAFYADRLMIYEESLGGVSPLALGPTFAAELTAQLTPILNLCAAHACDIHRQQQQFGQTVLSELSANGRFPFLRLVSHLNQQKVQFEPASSQWQAAILEQLAAQADAAHIQLDPATLPPIDEASFANIPLLTSPDVMLLARDEAALRAGDFQVVLAECHDTFMIWGWALYFHPEQDAVRADAANMLKRVTGDTAVANVLTSKRVKIVPFEYPGPTIEMMAPSQKPPAERIAITDVEACVKNGHITLQAPGWDDLKLYNGELPTLAHSLFALPKVIPPHLACQSHTPRITLGKAILQRERWQLPGQTLFPGKYQGASLDLMADFRRAARDRKLPRYLFTSVRGEPKPVFVDSDNYFLLELLHYLIPEGEEIILTEMLPTPDQLWLRHEEELFCAELRLSAGYVPTTTTN